MSWFTPEPEAAANTAATEAMLEAVRGSWFTAAEPTPHSITGALPETPASVSDQAASSLRQSTGLLLSETAAAVFAMLDVDGSGILTIAEISQKLGQDMRDREQLQILFPDLMTGKPSDLFVVAHGDLSKPHLVAVGAEDWNTYWNMIGSDVALEKLTLLRQLVNQTRACQPSRQQLPIQSSIQPVSSPTQPSSRLSQPVAQPSNCLHSATSGASPQQHTVASAQLPSAPPDRATKDQQPKPSPATHQPAPAPVRRQPAQATRQPAPAPAPRPLLKFRRQPKVSRPSPIQMAITAEADGLRTRLTAMCEQCAVLLIYVV